MFGMGITLKADIYLEDNEEVCIAGYDFNDYFPFCLTFGGRGGTLGWAVGGNRPPLPTIRRYKRACAHEAAPNSVRRV